MAVRVRGKEDFGEIPGGREPRLEHSRQGMSHPSPPSRHSDEGRVGLGSTPSGSVGPAVPLGHGSNPSGDTTPTGPRPGFTTALCPTDPRPYDRLPVSEGGQEAPVTWDPVGGTDDRTGVCRTLRPRSVCTPGAPVHQVCREFRFDPCDRVGRPWAGPLPTSPGVTGGISWPVAREVLRQTSRCRRDDYLRSGPG